MKLSKFLEKTGIPIARFAQRCNLTYPQIRHILLGTAPTLETALRIGVYTENEVTPQDLLSDELREEIYGKENKDES